MARVLFDPEAETLDGGEDVVGGLGPSEGSGVFVVGVDEGADVGFKLAGVAMYAALLLLAGQFGQPPFDLIKGGTRSLVNGTEPCIVFES